MADSKITGLTAITAGNVDDAADLLCLVDVSDTTMFASGTDKKVTRDALIPELAGTTATIGSTTTGRNLTVNATLETSIAPTLASANWTGTNGWSSNETQLIKVTNVAIGTITPSGTGATPTAGVTYKIIITASATSGAITYTYGGVTGTTITATTITDYITAVTTGKLIISGAISSTATITAISIQKLTNATGDVTVAGNLKLGSPIQNMKGTDVITIGSTGKVGIGTTGPGAKLDIKSAYTDINGAGKTTASTLRLAATDTGATDIGGTILFEANEGGAGTELEYAGIKGAVASGDGASGYLSLWTRKIGVGLGEKVRINEDGKVGIGTTLPATKLDVAGSMQVSSAVASTLGGYVRTFAEATGTPSGTTTYFDIAVAIPANCKLLGAQLRVDTALTAGETWSAAYITGSTTALAAAGTAVAANTKVNKMHVDEITSDVTNIRVTRDAGNFTNATGVIRAVVYYETFTAMGSL